MKPHKSVYCLLGLLSLSATLAIAQEGERKGPPPGGEGGSGNRLGEFLKRADTSGDGKISKEEFGALSRGGGDERFAKMDANSDGYVDQNEIATIAEKMREGMRNRPAGEGGSRRPPGDRPEGGPRPEGDRPAGGPEGGRRPEGGPGGPGGAIMIDEVFGRMDKNSDGTVDKAEYLEFSQQEIESRFSRVDENTDGKLTKEEMKAGMERMRNMMRGPGGPGGQRGPGGDGGRGPGSEGGPRRGSDGGEGGFRRPPSQEGEKASPRPEFEQPTSKKDPA
ncbi:EF-hand domain-containing protein [Prosthecobacter dejongeii]|uniref:Ca2+-binding EF-hand superfamily protein n=1 Tax=Prosthecobacter dejongeii TaxID=48465 RepID=A0A7W8DRF1_9BACT|nr:EF-hand domain-containing protein [Prosthecobacter dejongeii]MBB5039408.1 Ca2+-binding EF-hand superfamily protein [Prosthecobacter dejongeii]